MHGVYLKVINSICFVILTILCNIYTHNTVNPEKITSIIFNDFKT